jgi:hypothetical protein
VIEVNVSIGFPAGSDYSETLAYGVKLCELVEQRFQSASVSDAGSGFEDNGGFARDLHFEVDSTNDGLLLLGVLLPRLLNDGYAVVPERTDGLVRDENEMDDDRLTITTRVEPLIARVGIIVFKAEAVPV